MSNKRGVFEIIFKQDDENIIKQKTNSFKEMKNIFEQLKEKFQ
jgi:hypothetical protein